MPIKAIEAALCLLLCLPLRAGAGEAVTGVQRDVVFAETAPWTSIEQIRYRLLSPVLATGMRQSLEKEGRPTEGQPLDLSEERFVLYVPPAMPPGGYGLLVFVPPWEEAVLPSSWIPVFDQLGVIYVSAARSGNQQNGFTRREPLALLAAANVMARYKIDPAHMFVGGLSGGSRIAERLALGYPDLFRGALLNAGSDPLGRGDPAIPAKALLERLQSSSRIVFVTGERDDVNLTLDTGSESSFADYCIFSTARQRMPWAGHAAPPARSLRAALSLLMEPVAVDQERLRSCRKRIEDEVASGLDKVRALQTAGGKDEAAQLLWDIDKRFGGLAAPASVELAR